MASTAGSEDEEQEDAWADGFGMGECRARHPHGRATSATLAVGDGTLCAPCACTVRAHERRAQDPELGSVGRPTPASGRRSFVRLPTSAAGRSHSIGSTEESTR
ncbi:hypothetical protein DZF92_07560 [Clavibacter michiganensis subsp. insidiosus]|uniref:Uncharacterized protein n=1 Tax=Clavibacter michiganensis subsp. insidiosus TaxID=33014 RepID=A0A0D5CDX5_9MICO|nr:hypothetical protein VO01_00240 [Clavibacter michiganensis subsp. insidiosus]AWF96924.1 hypothetical protein BEH61_00220 [Clavibacter michiganensis subsp. insidiosus]OQJ58644.1 hypothetical protein B5P21_01065 [Clavibacter michiganensis subsp. insidiosus]RII87260.1 hypothetical protein DZF92_07560 [Clavibacter michiganensis subsp. insidiosus]RMC82130.1 hypothetical protein CmiCFBP2404_15300 [Clavibacter michiganensis subsp. insidiosus]